MAKTVLPVQRIRTHDRVVSEDESKKVRRVHGVKVRPAGCSGKVHLTFGSSVECWDYGYPLEVYPS